MSRRVEGRVGSVAHRGTGPAAPARVDYRGFAGWELRQAGLRAVVVPELGGRILSFRVARPDGHESELLWQAPDPGALKVRDLASARDLPALRRSLGPLHLGGHKTWLAPRSSWGEGNWPFLDLENGTYAERLEAGAVEVTSPTCRETGVVLSRRLAFEPGGLRVSERMTNRGDAPVAFALWSVTQIAGRGTVRIPLADLPPVDLAPSEDGRANDELTARDGIAEIRCRHRHASRVGTAHAGGWVTADVPLPDGEDGIRLTKRYDGLGGSGTLPHGCAVEVYDFAPGRLDAFEIELLTPVAMLAPGATMGFSEVWAAELRPAGRP